MSIGRRAIGAPLGTASHSGAKARRSHGMCHLRAQIFLLMAKQTAIETTRCERARLVLTIEVT